MRLCRVFALCVCSQGVGEPRRAASPQMCHPRGLPSSVTARVWLTVTIWRRSLFVWRLQIQQRMFGVLKNLPGEILRCCFCLWSHEHPDGITLSFTRL